MLMAETSGYSGWVDNYQFHKESKMIRRMRKKVAAFGDGTGPEGKGPGTGRGLGPCVSGNAAPAAGKRKKFDGTGPEGKGPMTGRGLGACPAGLLLKEKDKEVTKLKKKVKEKSAAYLIGEMLARQ